MPNPIVANTSKVAAGGAASAPAIAAAMNGAVQGGRDQDGQHAREQAAGRAAAIRQTLA